MLIAAGDYVMYMVFVKHTGGNPFGRASSLMIGWISTLTKGLSS